LGRRFPITLALFLSLINYARQHRYDGILAVIAVLHIIKSSGWYVSLPETGISEKTSLFICCWAMWTTKVWRR